MPAPRRAFSFELLEKAGGDSWLRNRVKWPLTFAIHYPSRSIAGARSGAIAGVRAMFRIAKPVLAAVLIALSGVPAFAADYVEPPVVEAPPTGAITAAGIFAATSTIIGRTSAAPNTSLTATCCVDPGSNSLGGDLDSAFSLGGGVGYQITNYLRTDLTADYWFNSDFNGSTTDARQRLDRHFVLEHLAAACQRLCRSRHLLRLHALCRRRHRRRARQLGRPQQHDRPRHHCP